MLCAVSGFCNCGFGLVVVDFGLSVMRTVLVGAVGKSVGSPAIFVGCSFRLVASFHPVCLRYTASNCVVQGGNSRRRIRVFVDSSGLVGGDMRISFVQAVRRRDMASFESEIDPALHPETRHTEEHDCLPF